LDYFTIIQLTVSLILASSSPFRKAVLERLDVEFSCVSPDIDESRRLDESPHDLVYRLSEAKAREVGKTHRGLIIASDQVATLSTGNGKDDAILTKPLTRENAIKQLQISSGNTVTFLTSLALLNTDTGNLQNHVEIFKVIFRTLTKEEIDNYLDKEDTLKCAGSFKSEGLGVALFERMQGDDPNSLIGLPTIQLIKMLAKENVRIL